MPVLDLARRTAYGRTEPWLRLLAVMAWPDDEARREEYLASAHAEPLDRLEAVADRVGEGELGDLLRHFASEWQRAFRRDGGRRALQRAASPSRMARDFETAARDGRIAAEMLRFRLAAKAHGRPQDVGRAVYVVRRWAAGVAGLPESDRSIRGAWSRFACVSHFWVAHLALVDRPAHDALPTLGAFLTLSEGVLELAVEADVLDPADAWRPSTDLRATLPDGGTEIDLATPERIDAALEGYRYSSRS